MAAHYKAVLGHDLYRILYAAEWRPLHHRGNIVVVWKDDQRPKQITLNIEISLKRVRNLCSSAKISAVQFDQWYRTAPTPPLEEVKAEIPAHVETPKNVH